MITPQNNINYRSLSKIFTPSEFRKISQTSSCNSIKGKLKRNLEFGSENLSKIVSFSYSQLETNYRNEYIYKNALLNQKLLDIYGLDETIVLSEFKLGNSIADFILLNGEIRVFEIKTDLDGFDKLEKQIEDYQKFAEKVYVVVSSKNSEKLFDEYKNTVVGIIELSDQNVLETIKEAETFKEKFDCKTIFKTLRKNEYLEIIEEYFGETPDVPNTQIFRKSLSWANKIDTCEFQEFVREKLKLRNLKCPDLLKSKQTPKELKHLCYTLDLSEKEYQNLHTVLKLPV